LGGCLPLLVQLPLLVLLWKAILYSTEEIHLSAGFLWMADLSLRDPYFIFVVVTTAAMILQQKLMTPVTTGDSRNAAFIGYVFPIVMAIFLWNFPAGLWMYYFLTTIFQVAQQYIVNRELAHADAKARTSSGGAGEGTQIEGGDSGDGERQG
jgi:YidC/Oxa1 family membrane protein insertase